MTNARRTQLEAKTVRVVLLVIATLVAISMIAAMFPHYAKWSNGVILETSKPGLGYVVFALGAMVPAALVWWKPRPMMAFAWSAFLWVLSVVVLFATFDLDFDFRSYTILHYPAETVFQVTAMPAAIAAFILVPIVAATYSIITRIGDARAARAARYPAELPVARVVG